MMPVEQDDDEFLRELQTEVGNNTLKQEIAALYKDGQETSLRDGPHLSDYIGRSICPRKCVLAHFYTQNEVIHEHRRAAIFENGVAIHKRWQRKMERAGVALGIELQHIEMYWKILFTPDIILMFRGQPTIMEIKGYNSREFNQLAFKGKLPQDAITQCNLYMWFTGIKQGLIIVECKDTQDFEPWLIQYDEELAKPYIPIFDKIAALVKIHQETQKLPPRLDACLRPDMDTPQSCGCRVACFATPDERIPLRRRQAWNAE